MKRTCSDCGCRENCKKWTKQFFGELDCWVPDGCLKIYDEDESIKKNQDEQGEAVQGNADGEYGSGIV